jgi:hypothetical protein
MRWLSGIFSGGSGAAPPCAHDRLLPRWRGPQVMDDDRRAMGFACQSCQREFAPYLVRERRLIES